MHTMRLGKTDLIVNRTGFGALPIQRIDKEECAKLFIKAYEHGINFFDTARMYSDSEEKIGYALAPVRSEIVIASKSHATTGEELLEHLETSLALLKTDYIDLYQLHNKKFVPQPGGDDGLYDAMLLAKEQGKIHHIGITSHSLEVALEAVESGFYETIQFPLSLISSDADLELIQKAKEADVGVIAMKALAGGLINDARPAFAFLRQYENVLPIWGIQHDWELNEFLQYEAVPPVLDDTLLKQVDTYREELAGNFCRGCGYCMPCPVDIPINTAARMSLLLRRAVYQNFLTPEWQERMERINDCIECGQCSSKCPYGLDTPELLKKNYIDYKQFLSEHLPE